MKAAASCKLFSVCKPKVQLASLSGACKPAAHRKDIGCGEVDEAAFHGKVARVERLLANLGYGTRKECQQLLKQDRVTLLPSSDGTTRPKLRVGDKVTHADVLLDGEPLDPPSPLHVMLHKPVGYVVTSPDDDRISDPKIYDLLPHRLGRRRPPLAPVGRLDKDTSGLLLLTDDGQMLHRINAPAHGVWKIYEARLERAMPPEEVARAARQFSSGRMLLAGDSVPLLPALLTVVGPSTMRLALCEGRYHQVRRMFTAVGYEVVALHRLAVGGLRLEGLAEGEYRVLATGGMAQVFEGPTSTEDVLSLGRQAKDGAD